MNRPCKLLVAVIFSIFVCGLASASDIYVAQNAAGGNTGADCSDAHSAAWFNTSSNWGSGSGQIGAGTTVHLCGIITSELSVNGSGASGNPVTILFETGAKIQVTPGCDSNGCLNLGGNSHLVIDGGLNQPCGWNTATNKSEGSCNGKIQNMSYGSSNGSCPAGTCSTQANSSVGNLILSSGGSDIEIRNLEAGPSYVHTSSGAGLSDSGGTQGIYLNNTNSVNIHDLKCHDAVWCIVLGWGGSTTYSGWKVENNELYNDSHMTAYAGSGSATLNGLTMSGNYCHDMSNWDTTSDDNHANCIHIYGSSSSTTYENITINNNIMGGNPGADMTAQIFIEAQNSIANNIAVYNNLIYAVGGLQGGERLVLFNDCTGTGCYFLNNTLVGGCSNCGTAEYIGGNGGTKTNIVSDENNAVSNPYLAMDSELAAFTTIDYNVYAPSATNFVHDGSYVTFTTYKSDVGGETHSALVSSLNLDANYKLTGAPLSGAGVNLSNLCSGNLTSLCTDLAGTPRPASAAWDVGAYQLSTGGQIPNPPTGLAALVQ